MRQWIRAALVAAALGVRALPLRAAPPTTAPVTTSWPASQPTDASTPKAALRLFAAALYEGDPEKLRLAVATTAPVEDRMLRAMADMAGALAGLHDAVARQFGEPATAPFTGDTAAQYKESVDRIEAADVKIDGERARVRYPGEKEAELELKRSAAGRWQVPIAQFSHGADAAVLTRRIAESEAQASIIRALAAEVEAGKFKTAADAADAWRGRIMQSLAGPTTTTAPTTRSN